MFKQRLTCVQRTGVALNHVAKTYVFVLLQKSKER